MRQIIKKILAILAKIIIKKYRPFIIGITGSVGKTSTKDAIALVLKNKLYVRSSFKNYNNEFGVPLTIINAKTQGKNIFGWLAVILKGLALIFLPLKFSKILVLEMAADKPGDIQDLISLVPCQIGVLTSIAPVHLEKFKTIENILKEKQNIVTNLPAQGWAIINGDNQKITEIKNKIKSKVLTFGLKEGNDIQALEISLVQKELNQENKLLIDGLRFKLNYHGKIIPVFLSKIIAQHQIYSVLAAIGVGLAMDLNILEIVDNLKNFSSPAGRMKIISGIHDSIIIDDSYNSSPEAAKLAIETLSQFLTKRKIAVLGEMLELGEAGEEEHREIGRLIVDKKID
ncbi:MAG: UDP-N-acetylmuramoyl-tripeptide--D-alanyl-D-alanine ligase, partial [Bacteroidetes bacterium]|nr:UDP-N-acetylmuramoyl-tripeptide--D-alanyl-D-alanine ligase [Bacteroidota bacterium]